METSIIKVTQNVETLLRYFRKRLRPINLWIDAICLNQADKTELAQQVQLMGEIYSQSQMVLVWMGDQDENIAKVFALFRTLARITDDVVQNDRESVSKAISALYGTEPSTSTADATMSIEQFFHRPWFGRRWVLQELALSEEAMIYFHNDRISWKWLAIALKKLSIIQSAHKDLFSFDEWTRRTLKRAILLSGTPRKIWDCLWEFHDCECFDPRDRIWSLVGFSSDTTIKGNAKRLGRNGDEEAELKIALQAVEKGCLGSDTVPVMLPPVGISDIGFYVDYTLSSRAVFCRLAYSAIHQSNRGELFRHALAYGSLKNGYVEIASWIPDWSKPQISKQKKLLADPSDWSSTRWGQKFSFFKDPPRAITLESFQKKNRRHIQRYIRNQARRQG